jgi:putative salt-induced outer membrane protein YdiY
LCNLSAIIVVAPELVGKKSEFLGSLSGSYESKKDNTNKKDYNAGLKLKYNSKNDFVLWSNFSATYSSVADEKNTDKSYGHFRYIKKLSDIFNYEMFTQISRDEFQNMTSRVLFGGGIRIDMISSDIGKLFFGAGVFEENINYISDENEDEKNTRYNVYVSYVKKFENENKISLISYFQPKIDDTNDYMTINAFEFQAKLYKNLHLKLHMYYNKDTNTISQNNDTQYGQKTMFVYKFKL